MVRKRRHLNVFYFFIFVDYPCPLISIRNRKPVFFEIGHTIMNLLADFRNFQYMLPQIRGITIHMQDKRTTINFPRNRYEDVSYSIQRPKVHDRMTKLPVTKMQVTQGNASEYSVLSEESLAHKLSIQL